MKKPMVERGKGWYDELCQYINPDMPVEVYKNLHTKALSVRQGGIVRCHSRYICLRNPQFKVSEAGRQRVLREQKKNVHAVVKGYVCTANEINDECMGGCNGVTYNPYKYKHFMIMDQSFVPVRPIHWANYCDIDTEPWHDGLPEIFVMRNKMA